jgi:hypothetical protein
MSIATLPTDLKALEDAIGTLKPGPILRTLAVVETDVADVADVFFPPDGTAAKVGAISDADKAACLAACDSLEACCKKAAAAKPKAGAGAVGAWGDGTFLALILQNLPSILALIRSLLGK